MSEYVRADSLVVDHRIPLQDGMECAYDLVMCHACGFGDNEDRIILCDGCDAAIHLECMTPPLDTVQSPTPNHNPVKLMNTPQNSSPKTPLG